MSEKRLYSHVIRENWCKACGICVAYCPKKVLELRGKVAAARPDDCIGCRQCELRCPDFAIEIIDRIPSEEVMRDSSCVDYALPPEANNA